MTERKTHTNLKGGLLSEPPKLTFIRQTLPSWFNGQSNAHLPEMEPHSPSYLQSH